MNEFFVSITLLYVRTVLSIVLVQSDCRDSGLLVTLYFPVCRALWRSNYVFVVDLSLILRTASLQHQNQSR